MMKGGGIKKQIVTVLTLFLALLFAVPPPALAGHIIWVDSDIDCNGSEKPQRPELF